MLKYILARLGQGHRTSAFPAEEPYLSHRFRGRPSLDPARCPEGCRDCADACPTGAITTTERDVALDLGRCLFCTDCMRACPHGALGFTSDYRLASRSRSDLIARGSASEPEAEQKLALS